MNIEGVCVDFGDTLFYSPNGATVLTEAGIPPKVARELWAKI